MAQLARDLRRGTLSLQVDQSILIYCLKLLSGSSEYESDPAIDCPVGQHSILAQPTDVRETADILDPVQLQRLEYLRPILGHIHSGGLRFKDHIEGAFKRQGLMLSQSLRKLEIIQSNNILSRTPAQPGDLLRALWDRSRELHYVAHFREPLTLDVGDIGYISGSPPKFTCLDNVYDRISDRELLPRRIENFRFSPQGRWKTEEVQGVVRYVSEATYIE